MAKPCRCRSRVGHGWSGSAPTNRAPRSTRICRCIGSPNGGPAPLAAGRRALGWWLVGTSRAMLSLARRHALDRVQFGRPVASFQAIRHRLAETLVAIEGAEATLSARGRRPELAAGQGRGGPAPRSPRHGTASRSSADRLHDRTRIAPSCAAGAGPRRPARQLTGTHPGSRRRAAAAKISAAAGGPLSRRLPMPCTRPARCGESATVGASGRADAASYDVQRVGNITVLTKGFLNSLQENTILIMRKLQSRTRRRPGLSSPGLHDVLLYSSMMFSFRCTHSGSR